MSGVLTQSLSTLVPGKPGSISLVIPVLNEAETLEERLGLLCDLLNGDHEIIVVDGGSEDCTVSIASRYATRVLFAPAGRARQMNLGGSVATGQVIWFVHADTQVTPIAIDTLQTLAITRKHSHYWGRFDVRIDATPTIYRCIEFMMNWRSRTTGIATGDQAIFVSAELFHQVEGYREIPLMEDIELSSRLGRIARPQCLHHTVKTSARRWQQHGVVRTVFKMWGLRLGYFLGLHPEQLVKWYYPALANLQEKPSVNQGQCAGVSRDSGVRESDSDA